MSERNPNELAAVKKVATEHDGGLELTFRDVDQDLKPQAAEDFADTVLELPEIDMAMLEAEYKIPEPTVTNESVNKHGINGNDIRIPDVVPSTRTARVVETNPDIVNAILDEDKYLKDAPLVGEGIPKYSSAKGGRDVKFTSTGAMVTQKQPKGVIDRIKGLFS